MIKVKDRKNTNFSKPKGIRVQLLFQEASQRTVGDPEFLLWLKKEPLHQQRRVDGIAPHTLHLAKVVQQENQRRRMFKKMTFQSTMLDTKSRDGQKVKWTRITTTAQFCDRD